MVLIAPVCHACLNECLPIQARTKGVLSQMAAEPLSAMHPHNSLEGKHFANMNGSAEPHIQGAALGARKSARHLSYATEEHAVPMSGSEVCSRDLYGCSHLEAICEHCWLVANAWACATHAVLSGIVGPSCQCPCSTSNFLPVDGISRSADLCSGCQMHSPTARQPRSALLARLCGLGDVEVKLSCILQQHLCSLQEEDGSDALHSGARAGAGKHSRWVHYKIALADNGRLSLHAC